MKPYFSLLGHQLPAYGLLTGLGIAVAAIYVLWANRRQNALPTQQLVHVGLVALLGGVAGAKLLYLLVMLPSAIAHLDFFRTRPALLPAYLLGGMVFYGGMLGALAAGLAYCRQQRLPTANALRLFVPAIPLFHTFGRVGCLLAGCCHGVGYTGRFAVYTPALPGEAVFPLQLVEAAGNLLLFCLLAVLAKRAASGTAVLLIYFTAYGSMRFLLEIWRGDAARGGWILSTSQWISLVLIGFSLAVHLHSTRKKQNSPTSSTQFDT